jgi:hypothetical protein
MSSPHASSAAPPGAATTFRSGFTPKFENDEHRDAWPVRMGDRVGDVRDQSGDHERVHAGKRAEAHRDHVRVVIDGPTDAGRDLLERAACLGEGLHGHDPRVGDARDADAVVRAGGGDAGDVGAVRGRRIGRVAAPPVAVPAAVWPVGAARERRAGDELRGQVGVGEIDARVDDCDHLAGARRGRPGLVCVVRFSIVRGERISVKKRCSSS